MFCSLLKLSVRYLLTVVLSVSILFANSFSAYAKKDKEKKEKKPPEIVTTIPPVQMMVSVITSGTKIKSAQLMRGVRDPHNFKMKPSQASALEEAKLVFYLDDGFEYFLPDVIDIYDRNRNIALSRAVESNVRSSDHHWLNPRSVQQMMGEIVTVLSEKYPEKEIQFKQNKQEFIQKLISNVAEWRDTLEDAKEATKVVVSDHAAFAPFVEYFELPTPYSMQLHDGQLSWSTIQEIDQLDADCLFVTHGSNRALKKIEDASDLELVDVDIMGSRKPSAKGYFKMMEELAENFEECLD